MSSRRYRAIFACGIRQLCCASFVAFMGCRQPVARHAIEDGKEPIGTYMVVALVEPSSDFHAAAEALAQRHSAEIVYAHSDAIEHVLIDLQRVRPSHVAFVVHPLDLDVNLAQRIFVLSTRVDSDPFVDFAWGVITGRDRQSALQLVEASSPTASHKTAPSIALYGVGGAGVRKSNVTRFVWPLRRERVPVTAFTAVGESDETRDALFIAESMPKLGNSPIVLLASHGYPDGLVGGPKAADLRRADLSGCVVLNIACYTGVTGTWYEEDLSAMTVRQRTVNAVDSFCLQVIDCGAAAYFAYTCPRPAGPTMMGDTLRIASSGKTVGQLFQENLQSVVLAHLLFGTDQLPLRLHADGNPLDHRARTSGKVVLEMSAGCVLFGDPAFRPFPVLPDTDPWRLEIAEQADSWEVTLTYESPLIHFFASDQINYWDERHPAMRMECVVPLGDRAVQGFEVVSPPRGISAYRWVAAEERVNDRRLLRIKINFAQPTDVHVLQKLAGDGLTTIFRIRTEPANDFSNPRSPWRGAHSLGQHQ